MAYGIFDQTDFPLIQISFTGEKATVETFSEYLRQTTSLYDKKEKIALLFDASKATFPAIKYQRMQGDWLKEHEDLMKRYCMGVAYTIPNGLIRGALQMIFKLQKQPVPFDVFSTNQASLNWLRAKMC